MRPNLELLNEIENLRKMYIRLVNRTLQRHRISVLSYRILNIIFLSKLISEEGIKKNLVATKQHISKDLGKLLGKKFIVEAADDDRRTNKFALTALGRTQLINISRVVEVDLNKAARNISVGDRKKLLDILKIFNSKFKTLL